MKIALRALFALIVGLSMGSEVRAGDKANVRLATRVLLEKMVAGRFDKLDEIYAPGFITHASTGDFNLEQDNESARAWRAAFPDLSVNIERTVANDNLVAVHWTMEGTNTGKEAGMPGRGAKVSVQGMSMFRFVRGRIAEEWTLVDIAALSTQIELGGGR